MAEVCNVRNIFLRGICLVYFFAFLSFYSQIPGLYGNNGILPARSQLQESSSRPLSEKMHKKPTLLWFAPFLGLNTEYMMDVICLFGIFLSLIGFMSQKLCISVVYVVLWSLYYSLYQVGQTFVWFQWDILLLEVGFLTIFVAPWKHQYNAKNKQPQPSPTDTVTFFLIRWLYFRFMFASGIVKLQSGCPTWWGLTALNVHFESQPLPTVAAWYMHHAPTWFLKLGTVFTHIIEQYMPFLFFFPLRSTRVVAFYIQTIFQILIIATGNYNFFNILTIILSFALLDDQYFAPKVKNSFVRNVLTVLLNLFIYGFFIYIAFVYFSVRYTPKGIIESDITFSKTDFDGFVMRAVPSSIYIGGIYLIFLSFQAIYNSFKGSQIKLGTVFVTLIYVSVAFFLFGISLVPYSVLHKSSNSTIAPPLRKLYGRIEHLQIANSYGLFRRMTGVGGRPEVIIEGANDLKGPWVEYHFKYKPGDVNSSLPFVVPHQPRLDWQMWFAALGTYHQNPWIMSTAYRILDGEKSVLKLLDTKRMPFTKPPKYIKASLYHYHFTPWSQRHSPTWWKRENVGEYFPIFSKDQTSLLEYLKTFKILDTKANIDADYKLVPNWLKTVLNGLRDTLGQVEPNLICWSIFSAYMLWLLISSSTSGSSSQKKKA